MIQTQVARSGPCAGCFALGCAGTCNYIFIMERRRGCQPGADCTKKMTRKEFNMRKASWDTEWGRKMWEEGKKDAEIADAFGIPTSTVTNYRLRHWEPVKKETENVPSSLQGFQPVKVTNEPERLQEPATDLPAQKPSAESAEEKPRVPVPETHVPAIHREHDEPLPPKKIEIMDVLAAATEHLSGIRAVCTASAIQSLWYWRYPEDLQCARDTIDYLLKRLEEDYGR